MQQPRTETQVRFKQVPRARSESNNPNKICFYIISLLQKIDLKALNSCVDNSKTIMGCRRFLNYKKTLICVPGHQDIEANCIADEFVRKGTTIAILQEKDTIGMPIAACRLYIKDKTLRTKIEKCTQLRNLQTDMAKTILSLRKFDVITLIEVLTGHCLIDTHAERMGRHFYDYCRSCQQPEEEENIEYL